MEKKELKKKAIKIKGNEYVLVKDRVVYFNENYPNGMIRTSVRRLDNDIIEIKAAVTPDLENPDRYFTGHSESVRGGEGADENAALENCETSAVGRALAMMGIGVLDSVASADEMYKAGVTDDSNGKPKREMKATQAQKNYINTLCAQKGMLPDVFLESRDVEDLEEITKSKASELIDFLTSLEDAE